MVSPVARIGCWVDSTIRKKRKFLSKVESDLVLNFAFLVRVGRRLTADTEISAFDLLL